MVFNFDHVRLVDNVVSGKEKRPLLVVPPASQGQVAGSTAPLQQPTPISATTPTPKMPSAAEHPDIEAARSILVCTTARSFFFGFRLLIFVMQSNHTWSDAHERWQGRTGEVLSPMAFGKRILPYVEDMRKRQEKHQSTSRSHRSHDSRESFDMRQTTNGSTTQTNGASSRPSDTLEAQRADINRIDTTVGYLHGEMSHIKGMLTELRADIHSLHPHRENSTLEAMMETVNRMASKAGEVDALRFEIAALKSKFRHDEMPSIASSSPQPSLIQPRPDTATPMQRVMSQPQPPQVSEIASKWNAVNTNKRKSVDIEPQPLPDTSKRPRSEYRTVSGEGTPSFSHQPPPPTSTGPPLLAPIRSNSQESWHHDSQRLPPLRGVHQSGRGRAPRLAQAPSQELPPSDWEHESWKSEEHTTPDSYYRTLSTVPGTAPLSPGDSKRGNLMRRGTGGGPLQYMDPAPTKRTRQRPVRNEHGILIRKDGKPDQRSISSPQNLRKVHERRMAEQDKGSQGSPESPQSPADDEGRTFDSDGAASTAPSSSKSSRPSSSHLPKHDRVMNKMFPHGIAGDAERMNHAAHIFDTERQQHHEAQLKSEMDRTEARAVRKEPSAESNAVYVDAAETQALTATAGRAEQASGSVYEPSQTQREEVPDSTTRSTTIGQSPSLQDSENRPLRPRHKDIDRIHIESSGSLYTPSEQATPA